MPRHSPRPRTMPPHSTPSPSRLPSLLVSGSSLLLASGLAASLYVWTSAMDADLASDQDAVDLDEAQVVAWWAGETALRWAYLSAAGSLCGVLGLLLRNSRLHRVFAITTAVDLLATLLFTLVLILLTFVPTLSTPFSTLLCSNAFSAPSPTASVLTTAPERNSLSWSDGVELVLWGVEACEESWRTGLVRVIFGSIVACVLRTYGTFVSWEMNAELREQELRDQGEAWVDQEMCEIETDGKSASAVEETLPRSRRSSSFSSQRSARRSTTLPLYQEFAAGPSGEGHKRHRSHTIAYPPHGGRHHPQLVLVPVTLDEDGQPVYSPSSPSFALPPYASPPRSRSNTHHSPLSPSGSSSRSSSRASKKRFSFRPRANSSTSTSSNPPPFLDSPPLISFTDEPEELLPPPVGLSTSTSSPTEERANRRARSRSENDGASFAAAP
ncbi:hypothetical protein JCM10207_007612 [Rhodosporidiobolus poonsookiae]